MKALCVVAVGNPFDGIEIFGPFKTEAAANEWIDTSEECLRDQWWIVDVKYPHQANKKGTK